MFGKLLSSVIKVATLPVDAAAAACDIISGGEGTKAEREEVPIIGGVEKLRDRIADAAEDALDE